MEGEHDPKSRMIYFFPYLNKAKENRTSRQSTSLVNSLTLNRFKAISELFHDSEREAAKGLALYALAASLCWSPASVS